MLAVLPVLFFALAFLYLAATGELRTAFVKAAVVSGLVVVAATEALSPFRLLSTEATVVVWILASAVAALGVWRRRAAIARTLRASADDRRWRLIALVAIPVFAIVATTGVIAWVSPPNTYDSMTYHLARVAHWAADSSIAFYPTNIVRQLYEPPFSEYAVLQLQLLSGGDRLAAFVQWLSMLGSLIGVSWIAQQLGAPPKGQALAVILVATLPMGILQATSTQVDYVLAFWLVTTASFALAFVARAGANAAAWFAASLGLAMLTKGTAYVFAAPLVILLAGWMFIRLRRQVIAPALIMLAIPLAINAGYFERNQAIFHNPLAPVQDTSALVNGRFGPQVTLSNLVRDSVLQLGTPNAALNNFVERAVARVHSSVLHIGLNDPATTWSGATFHVNSLSLDEDYAGDPLQALAALAAVLVAIALAFRRGPPLLAVYGIGLVLAMLVFASYLRWQPWHSRLELPLLVLSAPLSAVVISRFASAAAIIGASAVLVVASVPWVIDNQSRPLVGFSLPTAISPGARLLPSGNSIFNTPREDLFFAKYQALEAPYLRVASQAVAQHCGEIALWNGPDDWEYPLWALTSEFGDGARIDQVFIDNASDNASRFGSKPCLLVALTSNLPPAVTVEGVDFGRSWVQNGVGLYEPLATGAAES